MWLQRLFFYLQFVAVVLLPAGIVVARASAPVSLGATDIVVFASWPLLALALAGVLGITWARKQVRSTKSVSWTDVGVLSAWYATAILYAALIASASVTAVGLVAGLLTLVSVGAFWAALWQLGRAAKRRVETVMASFDRRAVSMGEYRSSPAGGVAPKVIRVEATSTASER